MTSEYFERYAEIPKEALDQARDVRERNGAFRRMLETYILRTDYSVPQSPIILNLGCGRCEEGFVLNSYFGGKPEGSESQDVLLVGIDTNKKIIEGARRDYARPDFSKGFLKLSEKPNYKFVHGDARELRSLVDVEFNIIVARHPEAIKLASTWKEILSEARKVTVDDGLLIATSYSTLEHEVLERFVEDSGFEIILSSLNMHSVPLFNIDSDIGSIDKRILLASKSS